MIFYRCVVDTHDYFCQKIVLNHFTFPISLRYQYSNYSQFNDVNIHGTSVLELKSRNLHHFIFTKADTTIMIHLVPP